METDIEQLELYLDGALELAELSALETRLKSEAALAETLTELKAQRAVRAAVWQSIEPGAAAADRLMWRVRGAILQQKQQENVAQPRRSWSQWRIASVGSAAAACLVLGFMFGRIGPSHDAVVTPHVSSVSDGGLAVNNPPTPTPIPDQVNPAPHETLAQANTVSANPVQGNMAQGNMVQGNSVPFIGPDGRVYYQKFKTAEDARQFVNDLHDTHPETSAPAVSGPSRLATEEH